MPPQTQKKKMPTWVKIILIIVAAVVLFFVIIFIVTTIATNGAVKISNQLLADVQANNASAAYSLANSEFKQATTQEEVTQLLADISPKLQGTTHMTGKSFEKRSGNPERAVVVYSIDTSSGKKYLRVTLQKSDTWQVLNFRASDTALDTSSAN